MDLLTAHLPSGYKKYNFSYLKIKSMTFIEILEYLEGVPTGEVEKLIYDINWLIKDDKNFEKVLLSDIEYCIFIKKAATISKDLEMNTTYKCSECNSINSLKFKLSEVKFIEKEAEVIEGALVTMKSGKYSVRVPNVEEFMNVVKHYIRYKKVKDIRIIKLISLFENFSNRPNDIS